MRLNKAFICILLVLFNVIYISFVIGICFAEEDISSLLSDKIELTGEILPCNELTQCKKLLLLEQKGGIEPSWLPNFYKTLKEELSRLNYKFVNEKNEADCTVSPGVFFFDTKDAYSEETSALNIDRDDNFPYLCSLSIVFIDKNGKENSFMAFVGVSKEMPVEDKSKYVDYLGKIYLFLLKKLLPQ